MPGKYGAVIFHSAVISDNLKQYTSEMKVNANEKP
jgi:hypothetical protein